MNYSNLPLTKQICLDDNLLRMHSENAGYTIMCYISGLIDFRGKNSR